MPIKPPDRLEPTEFQGFAISDAEVDAYIQGLRVLGPASMTAGQIDGLLAAVLTAPTPAPTEDWLASIWILEDDDPEPDIDIDSSGVARAVASILARKQQVAEELETGDYAPVFDSDHDGDLVWETWADGFMVGMTLDVDGWSARMRSRSLAGDATRVMINLIDVSRDDPDALKNLGPQHVAMFRENAPDLLTECVLKLMQSDGPRSPIVRGPKVGRNDPCPCGSGKKHKKCCGAG